MHPPSIHSVFAGTMSVIPHYTTPIVLDQQSTNLKRSHKKKEIHISYVFKNKIKSLKQ
jgi:hypothetical protein